MFSKIYGLFGEDNSFMFVKEKSCLGFNYSLSLIDITYFLIALVLGGDSLISKKYYIVDYFCRSIISNKEDYKFADGDIYEYNGINYYVILLTKIVPASYLSNISVGNIGIIQDRINVFLANNPDFVEQLFFDFEEYDEDEEEIIDSKKRIYEP